MRKTFLLSLFLAFAAAVNAQEQFKGLFISETPRLKMQINLYEKSISIHDLDFDETFGYITGDTNGTWVILKVKKITDKKATVRMVSDIGVDAQDAELTINEDGNIEFCLVSEQNMKTIKDRKYVKMPKVSHFERK